MRVVWMMEIDASSLRSFVGTVQIKYILDLSEADDFVKLIIEDLELDFDIGKVGVINFSFVFKYDEKSFIHFELGMHEN